MSWDGVIIRAPANASISELPNDFQLPQLGTTGEIAEVLRERFPDATHQEGQCIIRGEDFWLELSFGYPPDVEVRESIGVRTSAGLGAIPVLQIICDAFDARLFDNQTSEFADLENETKASMTEFAAWRDRNLNRSSEGELE